MDGYRVKVKLLERTQMDPNTFEVAYTTINEVRNGSNGVNWMTIMVEKQHHAILKKQSLTTPEARAQHTTTIQWVPREARDSPSKRGILGRAIENSRRKGWTKVEVEITGIPPNVDLHTILSSKYDRFGHRWISVAAEIVHGRAILDGQMRYSPILIRDREKLR